MIIKITDMEHITPKLVEGKELKLLKVISPIEGKMKKEPKMGMTNRNHTVRFMWV